MNNEQIDNTDYYRLPSGRQLEDFIAERGLKFAEGSALKYLFRAGKKDGESAEKDRAKAEHFINFIARQECVSDFNVRIFLENLLRLANSDYKTDGFLSHHILRNIAGHYLKAISKHKYFCDELTRFDEHYWLVKECGDKQTLARRGEIGNFGADDVLASEVSELFHAVAKGDIKNAIEEAYDVIAVLLRIIDVLEHRQPLGRPKEGAE